MIILIYSHCMCVCNSASYMSRNESAGSNIHIYSAEADSLNTVTESIHYEIRESGLVLFLHVKIQITQ